MAACATARAQLARYIEQIRASSNAEKIGTGIKGGLILGVSTPAKGIVGNTTMASMRMLLQQPVAAGYDYLFSVARSMGTGFKVKPHEFRQVVSGLDLGSLKAYGAGFKAGGQTIADATAAAKREWSGIKPGTPFGKRIAAAMDGFAAVLHAESSKLNMNTPRAVTIETPWLRAATEAAFGAAEAVDRPFFEGSLNYSLHLQSRLSGVRQGLKGEALEAEVRRLMANPTDDMVMRAMDDAMYVTFKDKTWAARFIEGGRRLAHTAAAEGETRAARAGGVAASLFMDTQVPFTGVPTSIAKKGIVDYTPLGLVRAMVQETQGKAAEALAGATIGSGLMLLGAQMAKDGRLVAGPSNSRNERADDLATRKFYAVKVGGSWYDIRALMPLAVPLFIGAQMYGKTQEPDAELGDVIGTGLATGGQLSVDNSFAQGINRSIEAAKDPMRKGPAWLAGSVPIPSLVGQVSRAMDPKEREARTFTERLMARTPARLLLDEQLTPMGPAPEKTLGERLSPFSPLPTSPDRDSPAMREVRRLGLAIGLPERTTTVGGKRVEFTRDQYERMVAAQGELVLPAVQRLMMKAGWDALPDEKKKRQIQAAINNVRDRAREPVRREAALLLGVP